MLILINWCAKRVFYLSQDYTLSQSLAVENLRLVCTVRGATYIYRYNAIQYEKRTVFVRFPVKLMVAHTRNCKVYDQSNSKNCLPWSSMNPFFPQR